MTCKNCGELVRITVRGDSYCWKHYDESLRAQDEQLAVLSAQGLKDAIERCSRN